MRLYLIRHGESLWNAQDRIQGHGDSPLSDAGKEQAVRLARHLAGVSLGALYTSRLLRARQTAEMIGQATRVPVTVRPDLHEIGLGAWEGKTPAEVNAHFENGFEAWRRQPTSVHIPDAEPIASFRQRAVAAIEAVIRDARDRARVPTVGGRAKEVPSDGSRSAAESAAIVTHGGVIISYLAHVLRADFDFLLRRLQINNTGVTILEALDAEHPSVLAVNDLQHLNHHGVAI